MLDIQNLHAGVENKPILKGINLTIKSGEMHAVMGRNGSGKSTLSNVITGREGFTVTQGDVHYKGESILDWSPENRALAGIFMSFQYPVVIPGVNNTYFLKAALNAKRKHEGEKELDAAGFLKLIKEKLSELDMDTAYLQRGVNEGFSGGEKKRNEILQMLVLQPDLSILDETDSGLDIDALKIIAEGIKNYRNKNRSFILITHYHRILDFLNPDHVHILINGEIALSGDPQLAKDLEKKGYSWIREMKVK